VHRQALQVHNTCMSSFGSSGQVVVGN
jgi:hypothetical protein